MPNTVSLAEFMKRSGIRPIVIARATGLHSSTIIRLRDGDHSPSYGTLRLIEAWAEEVRRERKLRYRLSFDSLQDDESAA